MSDQDTTAPGRVSYDPMRFSCNCGCGRMGLHLTTPIGVYSGPVMHMWTDLDTGEGRWVTKLCWNIEVAALEEMRVRAALARAGMDENGRITVKWELDR